MINATFPRSLGSILLDTLDRSGSLPALHYMKNGAATTLSWEALGDLVFRWVDALTRAGVERGDHVVHWSPNRFEWVITDLALIAMDAVHVPIHSTLSPRQAMDQIVHSESRYLIVAGNAMFRSLGPMLNELPEGMHYFSYEPLSARAKSAGWFGELLEAADPVAGRRLAEERLATADPNAVTTILYTSGTTGQPKGIMLSHYNLVTNAVETVATFGDEPLETRLNFLPFSHILARTADVYTWLVRGSEMALSQNRDTIIDDCQRFQPTLITGVPFFFDRVRQKLEEKGKSEEPGILQKVFGGKLRGCFSGGGPLSPATYDYYARHGVPLLQGYGLTETSPIVTFSTLEQHRAGSAGVPLKGVEIKIADDGEILTRGPHIMLGYWRDDNATKIAIRDGWFHTGDLGEIDEDGHLRITGRKKEMIVTATGKNVFPSHLEDLLCQDPFILQALVVGDNRNCLAALIVPDPDVLKSEIKRQGLWVFSRKGAVRHKKVIELYRQRIDERLADVARHEQVRLFTVLHRGFTIEDGYMTAKLSLRRKKIEADFAREIEAMYSKQN